MMTGYTYELIKNKKVIGHYHSMFLITKNYILIPEKSIFKQEYNKKAKEIKVPVIVRVVKNDGIELLYRKCLDVSRKSKRQINLILGNKK